MITGYYWWFLTANPVRAADMWPWNGFASETFLFESAIARNDQQSPWNIIFIISKWKYCWVIAEHCWRLLTANPVRAADDRLALWLASESFSCGQEWPGIVRNLSEIFFPCVGKGCGGVWPSTEITLSGFDTLFVTCNPKVGSETLPCK